MTRSEVPFAEVLAAVTELVTAGWGDGVLAADHQLLTELREKLHVDFTSAGMAGQLGRYDGHAQDRFYAQVPRALNKLADEGVLRKAGAGSTGPDDRLVDRNSVKFYTPAAWDRAAERTRLEREAARELADAWRSRLDRLRQLGLAARESSGWVSMDLDTWQALLNLAEVGAGVERGVLP